MKLAIHQSKIGFHPYWISYCEENNIAHKLVNCYSNSIVEDLQDCYALMWHFRHNKSQDYILGKQLLYALQHTNVIVFPDFKTSWHFNDKVGQKYLFELIGVPYVKTYVFFDVKDAMNWVKSAEFPKVFKLRGGASSEHVKIVRTQKQAIKIVKQAFSNGFAQYDKWANFKERLRKYKNHKTSLTDVFKGIIRFGVVPDFAQTMGRERGYVYFQDFIPGNDHDIRVVIVDNKAFAIKRMVRDNDFRASGSGKIIYDKSLIDVNLIGKSFEINKSIKSQCIAMDFIYDQGEAKIVEISYGFSPEGYEKCPGYWDSDLKWIEDDFNPYAWMVEMITKKINH